MKRTRNCIVKSLSVFLIFMAFADQGYAASHYVPGTLGGFDDAQLPPPGWNPSFDIAFYSADKLMDGSGNKEDLDFELNAFAAAATLFYTSEAPKLLGARLGSRLVIPYLREDVELSVPTPDGPLTLLDVEEDGFGDISIAPIILGWGTQESAFNGFLGFSIGIPTGDFDGAKDENAGEGFWSFHLEGGGSLFLDQSHNWWVSAITTISLNGEQEDTDIDVGDELSIEYGVGRLFQVGPVLINPALAGFSYWKLNADDNPNVPDGEEGRYIKYAVGPELSVFILPADIVIKLRYLHEFGAENGPEGKNISLTLKYTF